MSKEDYEEHRGYISETGIDVWQSTIRKLLYKYLQGNPIIIMSVDTEGAREFLDYLMFSTIEKYFRGRHDVFGDVLMFYVNPEEYTTEAFIKDMIQHHIIGGAFTVGLPDEWMRAAQKAMSIMTSAPNN